MNELNPTGLQIEMGQMIKAIDFTPNADQSPMILTVDAEGIPRVLYWINGVWEAEDASRPTFDRWIYLVD